MDKDESIRRWQADEQERQERSKRQRMDDDVRDGLNLSLNKDLGQGSKKGEDPPRGGSGVSHNAL